MTGVTTNSDASENFDAQQAKEAIATGEEKAIQVDVEADYAAAQQFSVSEIDRTGEGAAAAAEVTTAQFELSKPEETPLVTEPTGNPEDYLDMAKSVSSAPAGAGNVTDDLVEKAIAKGQAGES
jgi:hypothetical protein